MSVDDTPKDELSAALARLQVQLGKAHHALVEAAQACALLALAAFEGVRIKPIAVGSVIEARLYLPQGSDDGAERHRGRAAIYALSTAIELAMRDVDFWSTTPYFHNGGTPARDGFRGAVILDCGIGARAMALTVVRDIAAQLQEVNAP